MNESPRALDVRDSHGDLTRRAFVKLALGAAAPLLLAACTPAAPPAPTSAPAAQTPSGQSATQQPATQPTTAASTETRQGGQLILAAPNGPLTLNPAFSAVSDTILFSQFVFDGLTRPDDSLRPVASLAESWKISDDGLNYEFKLREGVKFHDGQEFTSADVKYTWETICHPANKTGAQLYGFFARVKGAPEYREGKASEIVGITTPDDYTVKVELTSIFAPFLSISAFQPILPKHVYGAVPTDQLEKHDLARNPIGTGPFKMTEWKTDEHMVLSAHPDYWGGRPKLDTLIVKFLPDQSVWPSNLRAGSVDVIGLYRGLAPLEYESFSNDSAYHVVGMAGQTNWYVEFNLTNPLFQDAQVRRALIHAIDREGVVNHLLLGHGRVVDTAIHPNSWAYAEPETSHDFNPDVAKQLLAEAGWTPGSDGILTKDGQRFSFEIATFMLDYPEILQEQWRQIGVEARINRMEFAAMWGPIYLAKKHEVAALHQPMGIYTDPAYPLGGYYSSKLNRNHYNNPKVDQLIDEATATLDEADRKQKYVEFLEILAQDAPHMWVAMPDEIWAYTTQVKLPEKKLGLLMLTNVKDWERVS